MRDCMMIADSTRFLALSGCSKDSFALSRLLPSPPRTKSPSNVILSQLEENWDILAFFLHLEEGVKLGIEVFLETLGP